MKKLSREFIKAIPFLLAAFIVVQFVILPTIYSNARLLAQTVSSRNQKENVYKISPSRDFPGVFKFEYEFGNLPTSKEAYFDVPIIPFDKNKARNFNIDINASSVSDAWGYPVRENAYMKRSNTDKKKTSFNFFKTEKALAYDQDQNNPSIYNCREDLTVTGYFKAYFEDVELNTGVGYDDEIYGEGRRAEACQVLQDISEMIMLDNTNVTPDILFMANPNMPPGALAAASSYFGYYSVGPDNGSLHKHIISRIDPTPEEGNFDAFIMTGFDGINWDVDSSLNSNTYDFYTVMYHEVMHTLAFRGLLPAVITSTGDMHQHDTFDSFSFKDITLNNPFINSVNWLLQVPIGAPSPWFVTNDVVYRGVKNIIGATPDGIRPIYSPASWQQGSSLSHFDMNRAGGQTYVMHPSIATNTERDIHNHEKEVLCHLGYQIGGLAGCSVPTPSAEDDNFLVNSLYPICVTPLSNDFGNGPKFHSLIPTYIQPGDVLTYKSGYSCDGVTLSGPADARSFEFTPISSVGIRTFIYRIKSIGTNRISFPATININSDPMSSPSCDDYPSDEYVCNGDLEMTPIGPQTSSGWGYQMECLNYSPSWTAIPWWCGYLGTPDVVDDTLTVSGAPFSQLSLPFDCSVFTSVPGCIVDVPVDGHRTLRMATFEVPRIKLRAPLDIGQTYRFSADVRFISNTTQNALFVAELSNDYALSLNNPGNQPPLSASGNVIFQQTISVNNGGNEWEHIEYDFVASTPNQILVVYFWGGSESIQYIDNISIKPVNTTSVVLGCTNPTASNYNPNATVDDSSCLFVIVGCMDPVASNYNPTANVDGPCVYYSSSIKGLVYSDLNQNGSKQTTDPGLSGIQIGLFQGGNSSPVQTTITQDIPNLGKYEFNNLPGGEYYVAVLGEGLYQSVTQPGLSSDPFADFSHMYVVNLPEGQTVANRDFGVTIEMANYIKGTVYQDLNQNGLNEISDPDLANVQVGLYVPGQVDPVQVSSTFDSPNLGQYMFGPVDNGTYYVALLNEGLNSITQPALNTGLVPDHNYVYEIEAENSQVYGGKDFGVFGHSAKGVDINISKSLIDSTLSLFDRFITWRIIVQNIGTSPATNVLIKEIVPPGLIYHSNVTPSPNAYDSSVHILNIPSLSAGGQTYIDITMKVPNSPKVCGVKTNIAVLHHLDQIDTNSSNNQGQASISLPKCKTEAPPQVDAG